MNSAQTCYRNLKKYKYQLTKDYTVDVPIKPNRDIKTQFIDLAQGGIFTIKKNYAWDGPSGPSIDTKSFMRGSLVHDALYQLMRTQHLDYKAYREPADDLLKEICLQDGMSALRAWYVHQGVRGFGEKNARPAPEPQEEITCVP